MDKVNIYYNAVTHAVVIDERNRITSLQMPADVEPIDIMRLITSPAFVPVVESIINNT